MYKANVINRPRSLRTFKSRSRASCQLGRARAAAYAGRTRCRTSLRQWSHEGVDSCASAAFARCLWLTVVFVALLASVVALHPRAGQDQLSSLSQHTPRANGVPGRGVLELAGRVDFDCRKRREAVVVVVVGARGASPRTRMLASSAVMRSAHRLVKAICSAGRRGRGPWRVAPCSDVS